MLEPKRHDSFTHELRLPASRSEYLGWLQWLVRLRWVAIAAQVVVVSFAVSTLHRPWITVPLLALVGVGLVATNYQMGKTLDEEGPVDAGLLFINLGIDVLALTVFFVAAGGPNNPFVMLYVIHVAMGAMMLPGRWAVGLMGLVLACYTSLFLYSLPLHLEAHTLSSNVLDFLGKYAAFTVSVTSVGAFMVGMADTIRRREKELMGFDGDTPTEEIDRSSVPPGLPSVKA